MKKILPWELIIAHLKRTSTTEQNSLFQTWAAEESHARLFREIEILWEEIQREVAGAQPDLAVSWKKMEARLRRQRQKPAPDPNRFRRTIYRFVSAAAVLLLLFGAAYFYRTRTPPPGLQTYSTLYGKSKIVLPDSSVVWLNAGTTLRYAPAFARDRRVHLEGEAAFEVTPDREHPFIVSTGTMKVKVYGTKFNVNSYAAAKHIKVALKQGSVSLLLENGTESFLRPGEIATLHKESRTLKIEKTDISMETFWASESVSFKNKPLGYICRYLEKWYHVRIEVDPALADSQYYTFTIKDDALETILRVMAKINPIAYTFDENNEIKITQVEP